MYQRLLMVAACVLLALPLPALAQQAPPPDARFTILVLRFEGPRHVREARQARDLLVRLSGMTGFYLVHKEAISILYYGYYSAISEQENPAEASRLRNDLARLAAIEIEGQRPLAASMAVPLPTPDPVAPPEWNIANAQGAWSLQVAAFRDHPDRKQAAVDSVRAAREMGIEAYFFHGPTTSSVLIGAFPLEAVRISEAANPEVGATAPPDRELVVVPFKPPGMPDEVVQADGTRSRVVAPRVEIVDPILLDLMRRFPEHAVNGEVLIRRVRDPRTGRTVDVTPPTFIVDIREIRNQGILAAGAPAAERDPNLQDPARVAPGRSATPGAGRLRQVGQ